jgi:hypothetical protein
VDFCVKLLPVILQRNYCLFDNEVWHQHIGFATGIACGAEVANLFIFALTVAVFARYAQFIHLHKRFIDDGFITWRGTAAAARAMFVELNALDANIKLTFEISNYHAIFLDLTIFKNRRFYETGILATKTYQKPVNKYLYTPFSSEHAPHCFTALVHGEVTRYIKRSSEYAFCVTLLVLLRQRLRLRGFPAKFLADAFKSAPTYNSRSKLLAPPGPKNESPVIVFSTVFSHMKQEARLSRAIFLNRHMLPSRFDAVKFITAWKAGQKIGGQLIAYRFPKPLPFIRY